MTPEERAKLIVNKVEGYAWADNYATREAIPFVVEQIQEAVLIEREACAKLVESCFPHYVPHPEDIWGGNIRPQIAKAIRLQGWHERQEAGIENIQDVKAQRDKFEKLYLASNTDRRTFEFGRMKSSTTSLPWRLRRSSL